MKSPSKERLIVAADFLTGAEEEVGFGVSGSGVQGLGFQVWGVGLKRVSAGTIRCWGWRDSKAKVYFGHCSYLSIFLVVVSTPAPLLGDCRFPLRAYRNQT